MSEPTKTIRDHERIVTGLQSTTFLGAFPKEALVNLAKRGHVVKYAKNATVYERGEPGDSLLLILSGRLKVFNVGEDGRETALNFLGPGDTAGEIAALAGGNRTASAVALEPTEGFVLFRRDLLPALQAHPDALIEIVELLCDKLRTTSEIVEDNQLDMRRRAARGLMRLARANGQRTKDGIVIPLRLSQRDLGAYLGMSRENTSRQVAALTADGLIAMQDGMIVILDEGGLGAVSGGELV
jgi:CRP-like cAMP-binding protein